MPDVFKDYFYSNNAIHVYGTRFHDRLHLHTVNSSFGLKCIKFKGCLLSNSLPRSITNINSHAVFKKNLTVTCLKACSRDCITLTLAWCYPPCARMVVKYSKNVRTVSLQHKNVMQRAQLRMHGG